jgi:hypothetical protein
MSGTTLSLSIATASFDVNGFFYHVSEFGDEYNTAIIIFWFAVSTRLNY